MDLDEGIPIFLVVGSTGEYDDHHEWFVCAYRDINSAQEHAKKAEEEAKKIFSENGKTFVSLKCGSKLDENMHIDYTGTNYYVEETTLFKLFNKS